MKKTINIASDFHAAPAGRYRKLGNFTGQIFREDLLASALKDRSIEIVEVVLDGLDGVGSSFWEEAFGGLIREENLSLDFIESKLDLICSDDITLVPTIKEYIRDAAGE